MLLITGDLLVFQIALIVTITIRFAGFDMKQWDAVAFPFLLVSFLWVLVFFIVGLYDLNVHNDPMKLLRRFVEGMIANLGLALAFFYLLPFFGVGPRTILVLEFAVSLLLGYFWRVAFSKWIISKSTTDNVLFIGKATVISDMASFLFTSSL